MWEEAAFHVRTRNSDGLSPFCRNCTAIQESKKTEDEARRERERARKAAHYRQNATRISLKLRAKRVGAKRYRSKYNPEGL